MAKETRIYTTEHAMLGRSGAPSDTLEPGGYTLFDKDNDAHKAIKADIDAGRAEHLRIEEVDLEAEQRNEKARQKLLAELDAVGSEPQPTEQDKQLADARAEITGDGGGGAENPEGNEGGAAGEFNPEENKVEDVLAYLQDASPEEVARVKELESASSRKSKQVADFEPKQGE